MGEKLREIARQITQDLQGDGFFATANNSYVHDRVERRLREALLAEPQPAPPRLSEAQVETILCGDVYDINDDPDTPKLTAAVNAALKSQVSVAGETK